MPRLVKGAKYVYGWSEVSSDGKIVVPKEALTEYNFEAPCNVILMPGSKRSGGFALTTPSMLENSQLSVLLDDEPRLARFELPEGETVTIGKRIYSWVKLYKDGSFMVPAETLKKYGVKSGDMLLSVRGSGLALAFIVKGPLIAEAKKHSTLALYK
jgi:bifunctional DNA-binding transcriptional regulator/antitoxin component of YhaV-PrlF toxin-antitoxin module